MTALIQGSNVLTILAPAKLNLALSVGQPDEDGMHPICSWMVTLDLCDELTVTRLAPDRFSRYAIVWHAEAPRRSEINWPITKDLAVRAHLALEREVGERLPVQLKLEKRIPAGGGLGGGSSNAAAMLRAVNQIHALGMDDERLIQVAAELGSDVPFFIRGGSAMVEGLGERITPQSSSPALDVALVFPDVACPTGAVYHMYDELGAGRLDQAAVRRLIDAAAGRLDPAGPFNDLAAPAMKLVPRLAGHFNDLAALAERPAHVAGSGSTLFVVCDGALHAQALAEAVRSRLGLSALPARSAAGDAAGP